MQNVSYGDNLHEISKPIFLEKYEKNISKCCLLKILTRAQLFKANDVVS